MHVHAALMAAALLAASASWQPAWGRCPWLVLLMPASTSPPLSPSSPHPIPPSPAARWYKWEGEAGKTYPLLTDGSGARLIVTLGRGGGSGTQIFIRTVNFVQAGVRVRAAVAPRPNSNTWVLSGGREQRQRGGGRGSGYMGVVQSSQTPPPTLHLPFSQLCLENSAAVVCRQALAVPSPSADPRIPLAVCSHCQQPDAGSKCQRHTAWWREGAGNTRQGQHAHGHSHCNTQNGHSDRAARAPR